ncbi:MAG: glycosyltransferase family 4 protein [Flavobacterium nitrogenifigens]|uniref:glycosyltransferase family 4 protein n=1 Tax=Flavobacterium nitrogenifigens TaxID=1617283 RepID=UPI002808AD02|nr:glycosyltransferase family 4 protein [Flavobacterium nitrogenifigens]MDQ8013216.1 glycosyltransferase family 4 protein [Flavobacterium nitrogenifigens]
MPIPSNGWGAVETLIWNQKIYCEALGHTVDILNQRGLAPALAAKPWTYDVVHVHFDSLTEFWNLLSVHLDFKLVVTSHYGYAAFPRKWGTGYMATFKSLMESERLIVLSEEILKVFQRKGFKGVIGVLPNGTETKQFLFKKDALLKSAICLGRIEIRKGQAEIAKKILTKRNMVCDFVGPADSIKFKVDNKHVRYLGEWDRAAVHKNLTNYSCLILFSDGEAHPLVILEAMAAGLSLVISKEASANLDTGQPWIHLCESADEAVEHAEQAIRDNHLYREQIRKYAEENFDCSVIAQKYIEMIS